MRWEDSDATLFPLGRGGGVGEKGIDGAGETGRGDTDGDSAGPTWRKDFRLNDSTGGEGGRLGFDFVRSRVAQENNPPDFLSALGTKGEGDCFGFFITSVLTESWEGWREWPRSFGRDLVERALCGSPYAGDAKRDFLSGSGTLRRSKSASEAALERAQVFGSRAAFPTFFAETTAGLPCPFRRNPGNFNLLDEAPAGPL